MASEGEMTSTWPTAQPGSDILWAKLIGPAMKVLAEMLDTVQVRADGGIGDVAAPQLLMHEMT